MDRQSDDMACPSVSTRAVTTVSAIGTVERT
jgi:hypothetical protein